MSDKFAIITGIDEDWQIHMLGKAVPVKEISECGCYATCDSTKNRRVPAPFQYKTEHLRFIPKAWFDVLIESVGVPEYLAAGDEETIPQDALNILSAAFGASYDTGTAALWTEDADGNDVWAKVEYRPTHCEQGNYILTVGGNDSLDNDETFPRYYMNNLVAKQEAKEFLAWRLFKYDSHTRPRWI